MFIKSYPMIGKIGLYSLTKEDIARIGESGNKHPPGCLVPMIVTQDWRDGYVNGTAFPDAPSTLWICSAKYMDYMFRVDSEMGFEMDVEPGTFYIPDDPNEEYNERSMR